MGQKKDESKRGVGRRGGGGRAGDLSFIPVISVHKRKVPYLALITFPFCPVVDKASH